MTLNGKSMNNKSILVYLHQKIHGMSLLSKYKPTDFENEIFFPLAKFFGQEGCRHCELLSKGLDWKDVFDSKIIKKKLFRKKIKNVIGLK